MSYRDDFYIKDNIIGYTGDILNNPTVYFKKVDGTGQIEFGRITQEHDDESNVGRNVVRTARDYAITNVNGKAQEYYNGKVRHFSRGPFTEANQTNAALVSAISRFTELKPKYDQ